MRFDEEYPRLGRGGGPFGSRASRFLFRAATVVTSAVVLIAALAVSVMLFAVALTVIAVFGVYLWWKTRDLRRQLRSMARPGGNIIEGEVVREVDPEEARDSRTRAGRP